MPIDVPDEGGGSGSPIIKKQRIGEKFIGVICAAPETRPRFKPNGDPVLKADGKQSNELVVTLLNMPDTTATASIGGSGGVPAPGDVVRLILAGGAFGQWIDAKKDLGFNPRIGDVVEQTITHAQAWEASGTRIGPEIRDQAAADQVPRGQSLGYYGDLVIRVATPAEAEWDAKACAFYNDTNRPDTPAGPPDDPFGAP